MRETEMANDIDYAAEYDNSARVANSAQLIEDIIARSSAFRVLDGLQANFDVPYGHEERNKMDIFWPADERLHDTCRMVVFIHGGYWQRLDRSAFSHMAKGLLAHDIAVAVPSYTLCPDIKIDGIVNEIRRCCLSLFKTYNRKLTVVGHSAGGHLAACMLATDWEGLHPSLPADVVQSGLGISGIYDLAPILQTPINDAVQMDEQSAHLASPIHWLPEALQRFDAWVGGDESDEFHRQSRELAEKWSLLGTPTRYISAPGENHFTVIDAMEDPVSAMVERIVKLVDQPVAQPELASPPDEELIGHVQEFEGIAPILSEQTSFPLSSNAAKTADEEEPEADGIDDEDALLDETAAAIAESMELEGINAGADDSDDEPLSSEEEPEKPQAPKPQNRFAGTS